MGSSLSGCIQTIQGNIPKRGYNKFPGFFITIVKL